jgi:hypothetical protein
MIDLRRIRASGRRLTAISFYHAMTDIGGM